MPTFTGFAANTPRFRRRARESIRRVHGGGFGQPNLGGLDQEALFGVSRKARQKPFFDIFRGAVGQNQGISDQMLQLLSGLQGTLGSNLGGQFGTLKAQEKLLGQFSKQGEADIGQQFHNLQSQGQQNLVSRGLVGSTILPTLNASVARQKGAALNRFRDLVTQRNIGFQQEKRGFFGNAFGLQSGLIQQVLAALQSGRQQVPGLSLGTMPQTGIPGALSGLLPLLGQLFGGGGGFGSGFGGGSNQGSPSRFFQ